MWQNKGTNKELDEVFSTREKRNNERAYSTFIIVDIVQYNDNKKDVRPCLSQRKIC